LADDDYYAMLGLEPTCDDDAIRRAWRELALRWHPDRARTDTTFIFQRLSKAYEVLSDPEARAAYDRGRTPVSERAPGHLILRLSTTLPVLLANGTARHAEPGVIELFVNDEEVAEGGMVRIAMRVDVKRGGDELYSAWLAIRPGVGDGTLIRPSAQLPDVVRPIAFRVRHRVS
jgi:curved DNA-binding protein CbpA